MSYLGDLRPMSSPSRGSGNPVVGDGPSPKDKEEAILRGTADHGCCDAALLQESGTAGLQEQQPGRRCLFLRPLFMFLWSGLRRSFAVLFGKDCVSCFESTDYRRTAAGGRRGVASVLALSGGRHVRATNRNVRREICRELARRDGCMRNDRDILGRVSWESWGSVEAHLAFTEGRSEVEVRNAAPQGLSEHGIKRVKQSNVIGFGINSTRTYPSGSPVVGEPEGAHGIDVAVWRDVPEYFDT
ncbi:hypothetical protein CPLU01_12417 [Colletotrichum plurivorum]|uniref:Uncharacterized protein n=1 Tax=Colletotrichum plurivorum TaxID=2175906 RepID=A0A8H6JZ42_9PEZI|nr:hypothetical protein CPLU01_12417 [Colletotrichum plurivorum]